MRGMGWCCRPTVLLVGSSNQVVIPHDHPPHGFCLQRHSRPAHACDDDFAWAVLKACIFIRVSIIMGLFQTMSEDKMPPGRVQP